MRHSSLLAVAFAACCTVVPTLSPLACSGDDDDAASGATDAAAADGALDAGADADAAMACSDGGQLVYGGEYCEHVGESFVTASTTKLELRTDDSRPGAGVEQVFDGGDAGEGCTGVFADLTFDVVGQTASRSTCSVAGSGYLFETQTLSLTSAQTAAMLAAWTEIRRVSVDGQPTICEGTLAEYPALLTRTDASGTETLDTCDYDPSDQYDDFEAYLDILAVFAADGGT